LTVEFDTDGKVCKVSGNTCPRGEKYAINECTNPVRTITSTVRCKDGGVVAVKTSLPIPKAKMFEVMSKINNAEAGTSVKIGDVIIENVCDTGADIIATANY
jgi:CxxC motif-containing protein